MPLKLMHPTVALYFAEHSCLISPVWPSPFVAYDYSTVVDYSQSVRAVGKALKVALEAARSSPRRSAASEWPETYKMFWTTHELGMMALKNHAWIIYCGNDCSPMLPIRLACPPTDEAAGEAFFALLHALQNGIQ
jgi:hypothetical protein